MKTTQTKIDVSSGTLSMEFDGDRIEYNVHNLNSINVASLCCIDVLESPVGEILTPNLEKAIVKDIIKATSTPPPSLLGNHPLLLTLQGKESIPSVVQGKKMDLKPPK